MNQSEIEVLISKAKQDVLNALGHLSYSYAKVLKLPTKQSLQDEETLETWESFCSRFTRASDLFLTRYLRSEILKSDSAFRGTLRDNLNEAEKLGLISDVDSWMEIRSLRNITAHEYSNEDFELFLKNLLKFTPQILEIQKLLSIES